MEFSWDISASLKSQIRHLPPDLKRRVWTSIDFLVENPQAGKPLSEELAGYRSCRIGKYRLIYRIKEDRLILEAVGPRSSIYERFVLEIGRAKIRERRSALYRAKRRKLQPATYFVRKRPTKPPKMA